MSNKVVLITENFRLAQKLRSKIILLRNTDFFDVVDPNNCISEIKKIQPDLVICGRQSIDGDTAQVGSEVAVLCGLSLVTNVLKLENLMML